MDKTFSLADICFELKLPFMVKESYFSKFECKKTINIKLEVREEFSYNWEKKQIIYSDNNKKIYKFDNNAELIEYRVEDNRHNYSLYSFPDNHKVLCISEDAKAGYFMMGQIVQAFGIENILLNYGAVIFHSNFIIANNEAILFTGLSGSGKSTQGFLWEKYQNAQIINGDRSLLKFKDGRLYAYGIPFCGSSGICENKCAPVKAIVLVNKAGYNNVEKIPVKESFKIILSQISVDRWNTEDLNRAMDMVEKIINNVPILKLNCLKNKESTIALKNYLFEGDD